MLLKRHKHINTDNALTPLKIKQECPIGISCELCNDLTRRRHCLGVQISGFLSAFRIQPSIFEASDERMTTIARNLSTPFHYYHEWCNSCYKIAHKILTKNNIRCFLVPAYYSAITTLTTFLYNKLSISSKKVWETSEYKNTYIGMGNICSLGNIQCPVHYFETGCSLHINFELCADENQRKHSLGILISGFLSVFLVQPTLLKVNAENLQMIAEKLEALSRQPRTWCEFCYKIADNFQTKHNARCFLIPMYYEGAILRILHDKLKIPLPQEYIHHKI